MSNVYAVTKVVGTSEKSIEDAISTAVATASKTLKNLDWFEVVETRGFIKGGKVAWYQVAIEIGFRYQAPTGAGPARKPRRK
ncbi:MAG: dodecin [Parvularculaceae bacterium]